MQQSRRLMLKSAVGASAGWLVSCPLFAAEPSLEWPTWRGPNRDGTSEGVSFPRSLEGLSKAWSVDLSDSYSGPIMDSSRVYTTETIEKREEALIALDRASGKTVWRKQWTGAMSVPFFAKSNGDWIRSTPATNGEVIVVGGIRDVLACFDAASGDELWRIDFVKDEGAELPAFGFVCSPLIDGDFVYSQSGGAVRKVSLKTGELVWKSMPDGGGMMSGGAFSSPIIATLHGVRQLVVQSRTTLGGVDVESGEVLWQIDIASFRGMNILTPTIWNDRVFTSSYGGKAQMIQFNPEAKPWKAEVQWESKAEAYMSSPVVVGDNLYMHLKNNRVSCIELPTGTEKWRTTPFGKYWSMGTDGKVILALDQVGELLLLEANPDEFTLLDRKVITEQESWAHIAIANGQVFVRRQKGLDAYQWA